MINMEKFHVNYLMNNMIDDVMKSAKNYSHCRDDNDYGNKINHSVLHAIKMILEDPYNDHNAAGKNELIMEMLVHAKLALDVLDDNIKHRSVGGLKVK